MCMTIECTEMPYHASVREIHPAECTAAYRLLTGHDQVQLRNMTLVASSPASPVLKDTHKPACALMSVITATVC